MTSDQVDVWIERGACLVTDHDKVQFRSAMEFIEKIETSGIRSLADVGSGPGHQAFVFSQMGVDVTCIDYLKPEYEINWIKPNEVDGRLFDAIWSHHCLEHIPDPIQALTQWRTLLNEGGKLFLTVPEIGLTMSSGHLNNFNLPSLIYILAVSGFDCSGKCFTKSRSHLRASVSKARNYHPEFDGHITSLQQLAELKLFSESITEAIRRRGRFSARDIHLNWYGRRSAPNLLAEESYSFVSANLWREQN